MAQHDYVIDNSTGANVRADINNALLAISSNNSGSSAPSTTYALQSFANTTDSMLQLRNSANSAFIDLRKFDGSCPLPDGTSSDLALFFTSDTNTGLFRAGADTINFVTGGSERLELGAVTIFNENGADVDFRIEGDTQANLFYVDAGNDKIGINENSPLGKLHVKTNDSSASVNASADELVLENSSSCGLSILSDTSAEGLICFGDSGANSIGKISYDHSANSLAFIANSSEAMRIDSSARVLVGHSSSRQIGGHTALFQQEGTSFSNATLSITANSADGNGAYLIFGNQRSGSTGGNTIVQSGDEAGTIRFSASDGTDMNTPAAQIRCEIDGTPGSNDMPGRLLFATTPDGSSSPTERMRINSSGKIGIGTDSPDQTLHVHKGSAGSIDSTTNSVLTLENSTDSILQFLSPSSNVNQIRFGDPSDNGAGYIDYNHGSNVLSFGTAGPERMRIDSSGRLGIGETSMSSYDPGARTLVLNESGTLAGMTLRASSQGAIYFADGLSGTEAYRGRIEYTHSDDLLRFGAGGNGNQVNVNSAGALLVNRTSQNDDELFSIFTDSTTPEMIILRNNAASSTKDMITMMHVKDSGTVHFMRFKRTGGLGNVGGITTEASSTSFNTSSDYRLKENEVLISDGITRLKTLKPYRFNFKITPEKTVDGFFAHEVTAVPEAITGEKDAVETIYYKDGDTLPEGKAVGDVKEENAIVPQSLDYAKITPLLTAALQEAISKIEVLETKVAALEAA